MMMAAMELLSAPISVLSLRGISTPLGLSASRLSRDFRGAAGFLVQTLLSLLPLFAGILLKGWAAGTTAGPRASDRLFWTTCWAKRGSSPKDSSFFSRSRWDVASSAVEKSSWKSCSTRSHSGPPCPRGASCECCLQEPLSAGLDPRRRNLLPELLVVILEEPKVLQEPRRCSSRRESRCGRSCRGASGRSGPRPRRMRPTNWI